MVVAACAKEKKACQSDIRNIPLLITQVSKSELWCFSTHLLSSTNWDFNLSASTLGFHECRWNEALVHAPSYPPQILIFCMQLFWVCETWWVVTFFFFFLQNHKVLVDLKAFEIKVASSLNEAPHWSVPGGLSLPVRAVVESWHLLIITCMFCYYPRRWRYWKVKCLKAWKC